MAGTVAGIIAAALAPAPHVSARPAPACPSPRVHEPPQEESWDTSGARTAPVIRVTDRATEKRPVTVEFDVAPSLWWWAYTLRGPLVGESARYYRLQIDSSRYRSLHLRLEWGSPTPDDFDLYLYDTNGQMVAWSEAANIEPNRNGFEYISGYAGRRCEVFVIEILPMLTPGRTVTLSAWLGPMGWME